jgi:outer membrane protein assembly factor BamB
VLSRTLIAALLLALLPIFATSADENWPQFRGPGATGVASDDVRLPSSWDRTENLQWVADIPGWGWSCPIVWEDQVFLTTVESDSEYELPKKGLYLGEGRSEPPEGTHHWLVYCFDLKSGDLRWKREAHRGRPQVSRHPKSTFASETPVTDGDRLYVLFGDVGLYCYSLAGEPLWSHKIEAQKTMSDYGAAASPIVHGDQVVLVYDNEEQSYIAAFDTKTGAPNWQMDREERSTWATPLVWQNSHRTEIITAGKRKNRSYDLSGKLLWEFDGRMSNLIVPSPLAAHGMLYLTSGYVGDAHRPVYVIKPGAEGDITPEGDPAASEFIEWYQPEAGPYNPSPIVYGDYYYTLYDRGFVTCHDARTGKQVYGKQRFAPGASFTASPWAYNGKLFFLSEDGDTYVIEAGPNYKLLGTNPLDELCAATPAVSQGRLLIRTASKLYSLGK